MSPSAIWEKCQKEVLEKIGETSYKTWFSSIQIKETLPNTLIIETPDDFFKNWIVEHYKFFLEELLTRSAQKPIQLEVTVNSQMLTNHSQNKLDTPEQNIKPKETSRSLLNPRFTFDKFVIGASNHFACAAGLAVAENPAKAYNPLFIYGKVGLGKTHLIQAITHKIHQSSPHLKISFMSSETFTNELINAIRHRSTEQFRKKYRDIDVLLIDDIHFIAGKEATQEEFFNTFNALHNNRKQIIITSDRPPKDIANLEERLRSRFAWGLIADIQPPDFETRVAILKRKVEGENANVPDDVIVFIAEEVSTNIRELEGALIRVVAYSLLESQPITLEKTKSVLKDMVKEATALITIDKVQKTVAQYYQISLTELRSRRRNKNIVIARQVAMYLSRQLTNSSLPEIGNAFGGKDHTTVLHSFRKIEGEISSSPDIKRTVDQLHTTLKQ